MAKQFKDVVLFNDDAKAKMHEMIIERIKEVLIFQKQSLEGYSEDMDETLKSSGFALNAAFGMEIMFLNKLLLVR